MPLEVFVHGALCVAYSGQCLTMNPWGSAVPIVVSVQACRLPYQLVVDGIERDLDDQRYLLSPQDLAAWSLVPELVRIGISSFKIEGRLKDATYVAAVTDVYRRSLDGAVMDRGDRTAARTWFSRGLSTGWLEESIIQLLCMVVGAKSGAVDRPPLCCSGARLAGGEHRCPAAARTGSRAGGVGC